MSDEKILLVDDEGGLRNVLKIALSDAGYRVFQAENGPQALEIFQKEQPSIVITDIKMPGMDGIELLRRIKEMAPEAEVIMITGHGDMGLAIKSLEYEATYFISKPINDSDLEAALQRAEKRIGTRMRQREAVRSLEQQLSDLNRSKPDIDLPGPLAAARREIDAVAAQLSSCLLSLDEVAAMNAQNLPEIRNTLLEIVDRLTALGAALSDR